MRGVRARIDVPHRRASEHHADAAADCLSEAEKPEALDRSRKGAGGGCRDEQCEAEQERRLAPITVRDRTPHRLAEAEPDEEGRQRPLDRGRVGREYARKRREGRQIHVGRERTERRQRAKDHNQSKAGNRLGHRNLEEKAAARSGLITDASEKITASKPPAR